MTVNTLRWKQGCDVSVVIVRFCLLQKVNGLVFMFKWLLFGLRPLLQPSVCTNERMQV